MGVPALYADILSTETLPGRCGIPLDVDVYHSTAYKMYPLDVILHILCQYHSTAYSVHLISQNHELIPNSSRNAGVPGKMGIPFLSLDGVDFMVFHGKSHSKMDDS